MRWRLFALVLCIATIFSAPSLTCAQEPAILKRALIDANKPIDFHALVFPETVYVGQQATYQLAVYLEDVAMTRLRRNPEFLPPEYRAFLAYDISVPQVFPSREAAGKRYSARIFQKALFPLASGNLGVSSPQLSYMLPQSASYFSREESHVVKAESTSLVVKPIPTEGRPADYLGAVGVLKASMHVDGATARVGDPLVLTLRVQGTGNVKLLPRPTVEVEWASSIPGTERLQLDTTGLTVKGAKEFDWILTPTRDGQVTTPAVKYSYFNPYKSKYEIAEAPALTLTVRTGAVATAEEGNDAVAQIPLRNHLVGVVAPPPTNNRSLWLLFAFVPLPALLLLLWRAPIARPKPPAIESLRSLVQRPVIQRAKHSPPASQPPTSARDVRRLLLSSLARRLDAEPDVLNERSRVERLLRRRGVTRETTRDLLTQLAKLDVASFASNEMLVAEQSAGESSSQVSVLTGESLALYDRVDKEALAPASVRFAKTKRAARVATALVLAFVGGAISAHASLAQQQSSAWESATTAYKNRQFVVASDAFRRLALQAPRDADALANWGTASWAAGDTVSAVIGWQRAARLDPLAADLREHLLLLPAGARDGIAEVPLIPVTPLSYAAIVAWIVGWSALAWFIWRKRKRPTMNALARNLAFVVITIGFACAAASLWGAKQLQPDGLAVVVRPETMRSGPDSDADALGGAATGDIVRVELQQQLWMRVQHADGRIGWLPAARLSPLGGTP